jgi:hypothetical protein
MSCVDEVWKKPRIHVGRHPDHVQASALLAN